MYGVAISASLAVLVVMLAAITLLPSLLAYLGHRVDNLRIPFLSRGLSKGDDEDGHPFAARWAHGVQRRPWAAAIVAVLICSRWRPRRSECGLASPTPATTRPTR